MEIDEFAIGLVEEAQHIGELSFDEAEFIIGYISS